VVNAIASKGGKSSGACFVSLYAYLALPFMSTGKLPVTGSEEAR
jgi:hypothetical protein